MQTDYKNLNDRIVKQAYEVSNLTLSEAMKTRLFQNKIDRAVEMIEARKLSPAFYKDSY
jgi:hypothetical protein